MPSSSVYTLPPGWSSTQEIKPKNDTNKIPKYGFTFKMYFISLSSFYSNLAAPEEMPSSTHFWYGIKTTDLAAGTSDRLE